MSPRSAVDFYRELWASAYVFLPYKSRDRFLDVLLGPKCQRQTRLGPCQLRVFQKPRDQAEHLDWHLRRES